MGPLHNIWAGMTAGGLHHFRWCTDLTLLPCVQSTVSLTLLCSDFLPTSLPMQTERESWAQLKVKPNFSPAPPHHGLCSVPCAATLSLPLSRREHFVRAAGSRMVPTPTLCRAALLDSLSQDAFLNCSFCKNSNLNFFFFNLAQINYFSKLSI